MNVAGEHIDSSFPDWNRSVVAGSSRKFPG